MYLLGSGTKTNGHIASHWSHVALDLFKGSSLEFLLDPQTGLGLALSKLSKLYHQPNISKFSGHSRIPLKKAETLLHSKDIICSLKKSNAKFHLILSQFFHEKIKHAPILPREKETHWSPKWPVGKKDVIRWVVLDCLGGQKNLIYQLSEKSWRIGLPQIM